MLHCDEKSTRSIITLLLLFLLFLSFFIVLTVFPSAPVIRWRQEPLLSSILSLAYHQRMDRDNMKLLDHESLHDGHDDTATMHPSTATRKPIGGNFGNMDHYYQYPMEYLGLLNRNYRYRLYILSHLCQHVGDWYIRSKYNHKSS